MGISVQDSGIAVEKGRYYLVNLNADPSLNEMLVYYLKVCNMQFVLNYPHYHDVLVGVDLIWALAVRVEWALNIIYFIEIHCFCYCLFDLFENIFVLNLMRIL